jgi:hypothetical protein
MKKKFFCLLVIFIIGAECNCFGQVFYSEASLYENGIKDYNNNDWQYASIYLFALIQKNPDAFATDPSFKKEVIAAFDHAMTQLRGQVSNSKKLLAQLSDPGSSQAGLGQKAPPLRPANTVNLKKY